MSEMGREASLAPSRPQQELPKAETGHLQPFDFYRANDRSRPSKTLS